MSLKNIHQVTVAIPVNAHFPKIAQCRRNCVKAEMPMLL